MRKAELAPLTGVRFYLALFVFLSHVTLIPGMETLSAGHLVFEAGVVGVSCFFVLSGFILTYNYAEAFREEVSTRIYKRFVWDRFTKIYPVHFASLLMVLPIQIFSPNLPLDWRAVPFHLFLAQCFWPVANPSFYNYLNVPSWSISCEWFFYLVAPFAMFFALGKARRWVPIAAVLVYAASMGLLLSHGPDRSRLILVSWFAPSRFPEFLAGVFLARLYLSWPVLRPDVFPRLTQAAGVALIVAGAILRKQAPWPLWGGLLYVPGAALLVLGLAYGGGTFAAHLSRPWLIRLGMASFSFYMIQAPILRATKGVFWKLGWEVRSWAEFWVVIAVMFVVIQAAALLMHRWYEIPMQKRLRRRALRLPTIRNVVPVSSQAEGGVG